MQTNLNSAENALFILYLFYIFLIRLLLEARAEMKKYFRCFLVQMKSLEFAFEIN